MDLEEKKSLSLLINTYKLWSTSIYSAERNTLCSALVPPGQFIEDGIDLGSIWIINK